MYDVEINAACGNLDRGTNSIYTTSCHDRMYRHGYICQFDGKSNTKIINNVSSLYMYIMSKLANETIIIIAC